jgi:hypothetical protein
MYSSLLHLPNYLFYYAVSDTDVNVFNDEVIYYKTPRSSFDFSGWLRAAMKDLRPRVCLFTCILYRVSTPIIVP